MGVNSKRAIVLIVALSTAGPFAICAELSGTVVDYVGATQPHAKVLLRNSDKSVRRAQETTADGQFHFAGLPSGKYELKISCGCLKTYRQQLTLNAESRLKLDIALKLGDKRCVGID